MRNKQNGVQNQAFFKLEEQMKNEVEKNSTLIMENPAKDSTIKELRKEIEKLTQQQEQPSESILVSRKSLKRKQAGPSESIPKVARVLRTRKSAKNQESSEVEAPATPSPLGPVVSFR